MKPEELAAKLRNQVTLGIDYSDGKDMTVICFYEKDAEIIIKALETYIKEVGDEKKSRFNKDYR